MTSPQSVELTPEPDLYPLYPIPADVARLLSANSGLTPPQKQTLVTHCLTRACVFADLTFLQYLVRDPQAAPFLDLNHQDEDGLVLAIVVILGFGSESDRDVEREECVRLLVAEGADMNIADKAGWTPLHHAALVAPPTLISHLLTRGCSPLSVTHRNMTPLDIVTAYSVIPGREDVALFLEEAMRGEGWQSSKMAVQRRDHDQRQKINGQRQSEREAIQKILDIDGQWWGGDSALDLSDEEDDSCDEATYTPPIDYSSMLVFSPGELPAIFEALIITYRPRIRDSDPANALYMLARFACLTCDHTWLEDLVIGATDNIEDVAFNRPDDLTYTVFWLYNCTVWLHLMRCDDAINETCEMMGSFDMIEEVINTIYVLVIRVAERRIDKLIDTALLDYSPNASELEAIQFESEWSLFRSPFSKKKNAAQNGAAITPSSTVTSVRSTRSGSPVPPPSSRPNSPTPHQGVFVPTTPKGLSSLKQSFKRARGHSSTSSLQSFFLDPPPSQSPQELVAFLSAMHTLLIESGINPAIIVQLWSQVMYWTSSEVFNRILNRKRYLCRSRALQIGMNLGTVEEWISDVGLPRGVQTHFGHARELLLWLQCLSSMDDFSNLIAMIQTMKRLNPLQMRRAVRDYRYELNETRMSDDCSQYLAQLQKDWERQRVRMGVEAMRKEQNKERDDDSMSSDTQDASNSSRHERSVSMSSADTIAAQSSIDLLFDRSQDKSRWRPQQPPEVLGELLESRYMLPLIFPSDPRMLAAVPRCLKHNSNRSSMLVPSQVEGHGKPKHQNNGGLSWVLKGSKMRQIGVEVLDWMDGLEERGRWTRQSLHPPEEEQEEASPDTLTDSSAYAQTSKEPKHVHLTRINRVPSARTRSTRTSTG